MKKNLKISNWTKIDFKKSVKIKKKIEKLDKMKKNSKIRNWTKIDFKKSVKNPEKVLGKIRDKKKSGKTPETR